MTRYGKPSGGIMAVRTVQPWLIALLFLAAAGAGQAPSSIHITGPATQPSDWTVDQLETQLVTQIKDIDYNSRGAMHTFSCIPLASLLKAAGIQTDFAMKGGADPKTKNRQMRQVVVVGGRDGYTVVFSLAEVLPMVSDREIWVAVQEDGKPLSDNDGPVRLIVPDDQMPARAVHQIASIEVVELSAPKTQPANP
jgi:hypothetical protein